MDDRSIWLLTEREKELECMYAVDNILQDPGFSLPGAMNQLVQILPSGFSDPAACRIKIELLDVPYMLPDFVKAKSLHQVPITMEDRTVGTLEIGYLAEDGEETPVLLPTEVKIMNAVSSRISQLALKSQREMNLILDMLQRVNPDILSSVCQRLQVYVNHLEGYTLPDTDTAPSYGEVNTPLPRTAVPDMMEYGQKLMAQASVYLSNEEIQKLIGQWIQEERLFSLVKVVGRKDAAISEIIDAIQSYKKLPDSPLQNTPTEKWLLSQLAHRFLTNDELLIDRILGYLSIEAFETLLSSVIGSPKTESGIGGKGAGLFIANEILQNASKSDSLLQNIKIPRTWYLAADQLDDFLRFNNMEEMYAYKYHSISYIRMTYDDIVSKIKNARLPSNIIQTLNMILDDLKDTPIIVRSSSLLEDRSQSAFSGKYKSLYLSNQGTKEERLCALTDAVLEVYSSQFNPDSFQYREQRHLLHFSEKMGILIQEVVGTKIGPYYMPLYAGVAFSENPLCWSPRITREGGLVRMVMGLGTRAVDRVNNDYPLLFSPQNPGFRINQNPEDIKHYSPKYIDLMNLDNGRFETVEADWFLKEWGNEIPQLHKLVSVYHNEYIQKKNVMDLSPKRDSMIITFDGIIYDTDFSNKINHMFTTLKEAMGVEVDLEFAFDGTHLYLLQCRSLNKGLQSKAAPIPQNIPKQDILFTANRFISNGRLDNIKYIVYVDGEEYRKLPDKNDLLAVGKAVGELNLRLPHRKFILMGPGRWGSRGDIQLGVRVTYADICNTALLIEIARKQQSYVPELSFGTHFFQDLVESGISYLPLYPDEDGVVFKESFFKRQPNRLADILPQFEFLSHVVHVIDLSRNHGGNSLSVYMNSDLEQAVAFLGETQGKQNSSGVFQKQEVQLDWEEQGDDQHWRWRKYMANQIAEEMDFDQFGVKGVYLFGSTDEETAGIGSDIDLLVHVEGNDSQMAALSKWLEGWSLALAKINYLRTGSSSRGGLLDVHFITDEDIKKQDSFAIKIHSVVDPATPLRKV